MSERSRQWRAVAWYCLIAYTAAWLVCLPLWFGGGLASPAFVVCAVVMMFTPTLAAVLVVRFVERRSLGAALGIKPRASLGRTLAFLGLAWLGVVAICLAGLASSALFGTYRFDPLGMSMFIDTVNEQFAQHGMSPDSLPTPIRTVWWVQLASSLVIAPFINTVAAAGEEIGWRGFLYPRLAGLLGPTRAVVLSGAIWGLWHAPVILLGYNYPSNPGLGVFAMIMPCIGLAAIFSWVSVRGGSVWPAAFGHGAFNAMMGSLALLLGSSAVELDLLRATFMGWSGWPVVVVAVVIVVVTGALHPPLDRSEQMVDAGRLLIQAASSEAQDPAVSASFPSPEPPVVDDGPDARHSPDSSGE